MGTWHFRERDGGDDEYATGEAAHSSAGLPIVPGATGRK